MGLIPQQKTIIQRIFHPFIKYKIPSSIKYYLRFVVFYHFVPTTATFYYLIKLIDPIVAYIIACTFWGTILYLIKTYK